MILWAIALARLLPALGACLPNAIPQEMRLNITFDGFSMPIGIASSNWNSIELVSKVFGILVEEVVGYHVAYSLESGSREIILRLGGCPPSAVSIAECNLSRRSHFALETWEDTVTVEWDTNFREMGERAPVNLGSGGYFGYDGLYVLQGARHRCQAATGMQLSYYANFNSSWFHPELYAATVDMVDPSRLLNCSGSVNADHPEYGQEYLRATGDREGITEESGGVRLKCWKDLWWAAPACRGNVSKCVAVVTAGAGWGMHFMMQQAYFHSMALAFSVGTTKQWTLINKELESVLYWWTPDETFVLNHGQPVIFPSHSVSEYKAGMYQSAAPSQLLTKWSASSVDLVADRVFGLARNLNLGQNDIMDLLAMHAQAAQSDTMQTACEWIKGHADAWRSWVPDQTVCSVGKGLVDLAGDFVWSRVDAVNCEVCPPGRASVKEGSTRLCRPCQAGHFQNSFRSASCEPCNPGSYSESLGAVQCRECSLGYFANASGLTSCTACGGDEWTTSQKVQVEGGSQWIQVQGASSAEYCACKEGTFLWHGRCRKCLEGSRCPGSNQIQVLPGYFSPRESPGEIFLCQRKELCPGGVPGTCADGRNPLAVGCSECLSGLRAQGQGRCGPCTDRDYLLSLLTLISALAAVAGIYGVLVKEQKVKQPGPLLVTVTSITQLLTTVQILQVIGMFGVPWREPFITMLNLLKILNFNLDLLSLDCLTSIRPVGQFVLRVMVMPMIIIAASLVHIGYLLFIHRPMSCHKLRMSQLLRTIGTIFMIWFIIVFSFLLEPFQCQEHPNGARTLKAMYQSVYCNGRDEHLQMYIIGGFACLMPVSFLAFCTWVVTVEIPKGIAEVDTSVLDAYFFLIRRLRPGAEIFSVLFQIRNVFVVLCPLVPSVSGKIVCLNGILLLSMMAVVAVQPWRSAINNVLEVVLLSGLLGITEMAALFVHEENSESNIWIVMVCLMLMLLGILVGVAIGIFKAIRQKYRKHFKFFLCHHKAASGSMARLLKIELMLRYPGSKTFVDCDDLLNLSRLFGFVAQDTENFVILGSPAIFSRKWCMGEMVTAQTNKVNTVLLAWPSMAMPEEQFIDHYRSYVPDIKELTKFGISISDVRKTLRWLRDPEFVETLWLPSHLTDIGVKNVVASLCKRGRPSKSRISPSKRGTESDNLAGSMLCPILVDPKNIEAVAAALVLQHLLKPLLLRHVMLPSVMKEGTHIPMDVRSVAVVCSENCFLSSEVQNWLLETSRLSCSVIPVIVEDNFLIPSPAFFTELSATVSQTSLHQTDLPAYMTVIKAIFQEIALIFVPQNSASTMEDLELRALKMSQRLVEPAPPLSEKLRRLSIFSRSISHISVDSAHQLHSPFHTSPGLVPLEAVLDVGESKALHSASSTADDDGMWVEAAF